MKNVKNKRALSKAARKSFLNGKEVLNRNEIKKEVKRKRAAFLDRLRPQYNKKCQVNKYKAIAINRLTSNAYSISHLNKQLFYRSADWLSLKRYFLVFIEPKCMRCGSINSIEFDHIVPVSQNPKLCLCAANIQLLCKHCNMVKSNTSTEDYRDFCVYPNKYLTKLEARWPFYFPKK